MSERFRVQLRDWKKNSIKTKPDKPKNSGKDISTRDIEELMGMNRPTYKRGKGGAFRQR